MAQVHLLWDASDIWGLLAAWALDSLGLDWKVVSAEEVAGGLILGREHKGGRESILAREKPALLIVPGGFSRHKSEALKAEGKDAIRDFVRSGGWYMGVCGGAGLGLSTPDGLGLCSWSRVGYQDRIQHFMSGHLFADFADHPLAPEISVVGEQGFPHRAGSLEGRDNLRAVQPLLPVWWPGLFDPYGVENDDLAVLARYGESGPDFRLADILISSFPPHLLETWKVRYGFSPSPAFLKGQPCVLHGHYGAGSYTLSYSHLETPDSPFANAWLVSLLRQVGGLSPAQEGIPVWDLDMLAPQWQDDDLLSVSVAVDRILEIGRDAGLLFARTPWLAGWRMGMPGAQLGSLRALIRSILAFPPGAQAAALWESSRKCFMSAFSSFRQRTESYLLAEQLALTLNRAEPDFGLSEKLQDERRELFGLPGMVPGGSLRTLVFLLDRLAFLQLRR